MKVYFTTEKFLKLFFIFHLVSIISKEGVMVAIYRFKKLIAEAGSSCRGGRFRKSIGHLAGKGGLRSTACCSLAR